MKRLILKRESGCQQNDSLANGYPEGATIEDQGFGWKSRRRDCHCADIPSSSILKRPLKGDGNAAEWQSRRRLGWKNSFGSGKGVHTITSGLEGAWTTSPVIWDNGYFDNLFGFEWELTKGAGGAQQWTPKDGGGSRRRDCHFAGTPSSSLLKRPG